MHYRSPYRIWESFHPNGFKLHYQQLVNFPKSPKPPKSNPNTNSQIRTPKLTLKLHINFTNSATRTLLQHQPIQQLALQSISVDGNRRKWEKHSPKWRYFGFEWYSFSKSRIYPSKFSHVAITWSEVTESVTDGPSWYKIKSLRMFQMKILVGGPKWYWSNSWGTI